jgi:peptide/nickel transport system ATP-binding protein
MSVIFVTHDLGVAAQIADKVAVMYAGRIVEFGDVHDVLLNPQHPYTRGMLASTVKDQPRGERLGAIAGSPPDLRALPPGCSFAPRCKFAKDEFTGDVPLPVTDETGHMARCFNVGLAHGRLRFAAEGAAAPPT